MTFTERLIGSIGKSGHIDIKQSFSYYNASGDFQDLVLNDESFIYLKEVLSNLKGIDEHFTLEIKNGDNDVVIFSNDNDLSIVTEKCEEFIESFEAHERTHFKVEWSQNERNKHKPLIFDVASFFKFLREEKLVNVLEGLSCRFNNQNIKFYCFEDSEDFSNDYFNFISVGADAKYLNKFNSNEQDKLKIDLYDARVDLRNKASHFFNAESLRFIPEHFSFDMGISNEYWKEAFERWEAIFYLVYLSDYSSIEEDVISFKIKGYKTLSGRTDGKVPKTVLKELRLIYEWVYSDGPFIDKIGIARNVLSIHIVNDDINTLEVGTCASAQSGYDLYLKDNVRQYIEIKNKIADMLHSQSEKATSIVKDMFNMFKNSMWTFLTFFITVFLFRSKLGSENGQNSGVFWVGIALIGLSFFYIMFARREVDDEKDRLNKKYTEISNRYKDLLNEADLEKILQPTNGGSSKQIELDYIDKKKKRYTIYWLCLNIIILIVWLLIFFEEVEAITGKLLNLTSSFNIVRNFFS